MKKYKTTGRINKRRIKMKEYEIKTLQDIIDCVDEKNVDNFLADFAEWLKTMVDLQTMGLIQNIKSEKFTWIDDGEHKIKLTMKEQ